MSDTGSAAGKIGEPRGSSASMIHYLAFDQTAWLLCSMSSMVAVPYADDAVDAGMTELNAPEGLTHGKEDAPQEAKA